MYKISTNAIMFKFRAEAEKEGKWFFITFEAEIINEWKLREQLNEEGYKLQSVYVVGSYMI